VGTGRRLALLIVAVLMAATACGGGSDDSSGFVKLYSTDTYGVEWTLYGEAKAGRWTGCLRFVADDGTKVKRCAPPTKDLVVYKSGGDAGLQYGAVPTGTKLEGNEEGRTFDVFLFGNSAIDDYRFFGIVDTAQIRVR
jgi:hypothetical protein